ncbi:MAG: putative permease [Rickettsiales bacterium]|jgi:predicted permease
MVYYVLLPLILFINISSAPYQDISKYFGMINAAMAAISIVILLVFLGKFIFRIKNPDFISLFQGSIYANVAYIGIPASYALFGSEGLMIYSILLAAVVPFVNAVTIIVLSIYSGGNGENIFKSIAKKLLFHPIILACVVGFLSSYFDIILPKIISNSFDILSGAAVPLGLMVVGGALNIAATKGSRKYILVATLIKLILLPIIAIALAKSFGVVGLNEKILILYATLPTAAATYLLAKKMGGNAPLMAGIIVFQTIASIGTMAFMMAK